MTGFRGILALFGLWLLAWALCGCAGLPVGKSTFLMAGIGVVRIDRQDRAVGIRTVSAGLMLGCRQAVVGVQSSFCAAVPADGNVAILEQGSQPNKHLFIRKPEGGSNEVLATAIDR